MESVRRHRGLYSKARSDKGRGTGEEKQAPRSTRRPFADGFLNHRFLPMVKGREPLKDWRSEQQAFFCSIRSLAAHYGFEPADVSGKVYPYNMYLALRHAEGYVKSKNESLFITSSGDQKTCLATAKPYSTGSRLYYLPLRPLQRLLSGKKQRRQANLLLSVCAYLLKTVQVPAWFDGDYIGCRYEMIEEWVGSGWDEWEPQEYCEILSETRAAEFFGDKLRKQLNHPYHLQQWEKRLAGFRIKDKTDQQIYDAAAKTFALCRAYPDRSLYEHYYIGLLEPQEEERVYPDRYISFIWSQEGWLFEQLMESVDADLQEVGVTEEPLFVWHFDGQGSRLQDDLDFEKRVFELLGDLATILFNL